MISYSPLLCLDFYKTAHAEQYPAALTKMVSYYTPRMTRLADTKKVTMFGLQAFIQEYLIEAFNTHFFDRSLDEVLAEYKRVLNNTIGTDGVGVERLTALHKLGYLPLEIRAVPEGTRTSIHVPQMVSPGQVPCASLGSYGNMAIPANLAFVGFNLQQSKSRGAAMKMDKVAGSGNDEFYTPEYAITPLYKYLPPPP